MSMSELRGSKESRLTPSEVKQLQVAVLVGLALASAMFVQLIGRDGSMDTADWLRIVIGVTGLGASAASTVVQARRR